MKRRINEHIVSFHFPAVPESAAGRDYPGSGVGSLAAQTTQPAEFAAAAFRSSFGHRAHVGRAAADVSNGDAPGRRRIVNSESFHGAVGITHTSKQCHATDADVICVTREAVVQHHRRSVIVDCGEAEPLLLGGGGDRQQQMRHGRLSSSQTLPRNLQQQHQRALPQNPQNSIKSGSFCDDWRGNCPALPAPVSPPPPPLQIPASSPLRPAATASLSGNGADSGLGGSDSSSFTFAEMHHQVSAEVGPPRQHFLPKKSIAVGRASFTPLEEYAADDEPGRAAV